MRQHVIVCSAALHLTMRFDLLAVFLGFVVLLPVLVQPMMPLDIPAFRQLPAAHSLLQLLDEPTMRLVAMLSFSVLLRPRPAPLPVPHLITW